MRHLFYLQQFFERFPAPAFIKDNKFKYVWINKEWEKFFGINERRVIGKTNKKLFGEDLHEEIDKKVIKTKKAVTYTMMFNDKFLIINKIPIRLGDGTYGVAGFILDDTERYLFELSLQGLLKVNEILRDMLLENYQDKDSFILDFFENIYKRSQMGEYAILKGDVILKSYLPEKVCRRAISKDEFKEFSVDNEKWIVVPISEYKLLLKSQPNYYKILKNMYPVVISKIENVLDTIEKKLKEQLYYKALEKMVDFVVSWKNMGTKDLKTFLKKVLVNILEIIPEAEKGSIWLLNKDKYECVAEVGYPGAISLNFPASKTAYGTEIEKKIKNGEKVFEIENAKELVEKSELKDVLSSYGMNNSDFVPLIGVFNIGEKFVGNISLDNFKGKHFSNESKKLLSYFVDILSEFLSEKF